MRLCPPGAAANQDWHRHTDHNPHWLETWDQRLPPLSLSPPVSTRLGLLCPAFLRLSLSLPVYFTPSRSHTFLLFTFTFVLHTCFNRATLIVKLDQDKASQPEMFQHKMFNSLADSRSWLEPWLARYSRLTTGVMKQFSQQKGYH